MNGYEEFKSVIIGCDHAGYELKNKIREHMKAKGFVVKDVNEHYENPICFVEPATKVAETVSEKSGTLGILVCGTGVGMAIAANRYKGVFAAILYDDFTAEYSRRHNNANVLVFGSRTMKEEEVLKRIDIFLAQKYEAGKYHLRNIAIDEK
ncbi:MAG TPA: RpiB/LacA/LacB family sugar-phosphate isomerase [Thermoanaerobacterales bacterium]|jgi:ribose 5-phosphate isomerase B|nr:RpiB/LacA/LacB family sugar-phosphate isomerase [Thermoanaerobacterales bacterium]